VCQTCIFDLEYGLPVAVRDKFLKDCEAAGIPQSEIRGSSDPEIKEKLALLSKKYPSYKRNQPHICSFFVKGNCERGANCPYRHEMPEEEEQKLDENGKKIKNLSVEQSIRDRFNGVNDSLANKILTKMKKHEKPTPPEDKNITTLMIRGVEEGLNEADITEFFKRYGKIQAIRIRLSKNLAFVCFESRSGAELAMDHLWSKLYIKERLLKLFWAHYQLDPSKIRKRTRDLVDSKTGEPTKKIKIEADKGGYFPSMDPSNYGGSMKKREAKLERKEKDV